jgi:hypothetical protein
VHQVCATWSAALRQRFRDFAASAMPAQILQAAVLISLGGSRCFVTIRVSTCADVPSKQSIASVYGAAKADLRCSEQILVCQRRTGQAFDVLLRLAAGHCKASTGSHVTMWRVNLGGHLIKGLCVPLRRQRK